MKRVSAVIVTFNNASMLKGLLEDLEGQSRPPDEILVVDNASVDGTRDLVRGSFPGVKYLRLPENTGSAGGYHEGIRAALPQSDLIWTLDDDVRLEVDSLEMLLRGLEELDARRCIGAVRSVGQRRPSSARPTRLALFPWRGTLIKSEAVRRLGLPLKEFFIYGEDLEYAMRFNAAGLPCFWIPASVCTERRLEGKDDYRLLGASVRVYSSPFQLYYAFRNNIFVFVRYRDFHRLVRTLLYAVKAFLFILVLEGPRGFQKLAAIIEGLFHGFRGRLGRNTAYLPG
ncbi:MAG: glycosyltransferase [Deltaproteobacteria bacterium]|nr:glycosyltransferase [Deltaproteobacteria bacterium]